MKTIPKKKIEIVVERTLVDAMVSVIDESGATGYTLVPCSGGRGRHGAWEAGQLSAAFDRMYILVLAEPSVAQSILDGIEPYLSRYSMVVNISDTEVIRGHAF